METPRHKRDVLNEIDILLKGLRAIKETIQNIEDEIQGEHEKAKSRDI